MKEEVKQKTGIPLWIKCVIAVLLLLLVWLSLMLRNAFTTMESYHNALHLSSIQYHFAVDTMISPSEKETLEDCLRCISLEWRFFPESSDICQELRFDPKSYDVEQLRKKVPEPEYAKDEIDYCIQAIAKNEKKRQIFSMWEDIFK